MQTKKVIILDYVINKKVAINSTSKLEKVTEKLSEIGYIHEGNKEFKIEKHLNMKEKTLYIS